MSAREKEVWSKAKGRERLKHSVERARRGGGGLVGARSVRRLKFGWLSRTASTKVVGLVRQGETGVNVRRKEKRETDLRFGQAFGRGRREERARELTVG